MCVQIVIRAVAYGIDVPLWIERPNIDLKICTYDRLYQDSVVIRNRLFTVLCPYMCFFHLVNPVFHIH